MKVRWVTVLTEGHMQHWELIAMRLLMAARRSGQGLWGNSEVTRE